jgi:hypothetical protein
VMIRRTRAKPVTPPFILAIYDLWVLGFMARAVWHSPTPAVIERYGRLLGRRHLDVGPGTGYFIDKADPPAGTEVTLLDPNPNVLARTSRRLAAMRPTVVEADVMKPLPVSGPFDSAGRSSKRRSRKARWSGPSRTSPRPVRARPLPSDHGWRRA